MSTRSTLWYSDEFHLYKEAGDNSHVYLEVRSPHFEELVLRIPLAAWKEMRQHTIQPSERYLDLSADELRKEAEREVDAHRERLDSIRKEDGPGQALLMSSGILQYGPPDSSREEMVESFLRHYRQNLSEPHHS